MLRRSLSEVWFAPNASGKDASPDHRVPQFVVRSVLKPLAWMYRSVVAYRRRKHGSSSERATQLRVPVVVIGNLIVGGSGKTPLTIALVEALRAAGYVPGVVSRGYGGAATRSRKAVEAVDETREDAAAFFGDEAVLIREKSGAPVFIARQRVAAAEALLAAHPEVDVVLADDGLQHYALARNFEIAVFDVRGVGNGHMLPAGPLREPLGRAGEVDAIVLNGEDTVLPAGIQPLNTPYRMLLLPGLPYRVNNPAETREVPKFRGRRLTAAAGIGHPERFFAMLRSMDLSFHRMPLDDHYAFDSNPFVLRNSEAILMTEKDAVKCRRFDESRMWAIPVTAHIDDMLVEAVLAHIGGRKNGPVVAPLVAEPVAESIASRG